METIRDKKAQFHLAVAFAKLAFVDACALRVGVVFAVVGEFLLASAAVLPRACRADSFRANTVCVETRDTTVMAPFVLETTTRRQLVIFCTCLIFCRSFFRLKKRFLCNVIVFFIAVFRRAEMQQTRSDL